MSVNALTAIKADILIPVYNAPYRLRDLLETLLINTNPELVNQIILGDDASDAKTKELIKSFLNQYSFNLKVITNEKNVGYLKNVNSLFAASDADIAVILNTDTLLPVGWLDRICAPFQSDQKIALATPFATNATNLTIKPRIGQTWKDVDRHLSKQTACYPDAHTAIGYCLAVRRELFINKPLLDEIYNLGYWEDTDLHYRVIQMGYRSVVIDNLLIFHAHGSSSFSTKHDLNHINDVNKALFEKKWLSLHEKCNHQYMQQKPYISYRNEYTHQYNYNENNQHLDFLFVLPVIEAVNGGVSVVVKLVEFLLTKNIRANILVYGHVDQQYVYFNMAFNPWRNIKILRKQVSSVKVVIATSYTSVKYARDLATHYQAQLSYFVQGPESLFDNGVHFATILNDYQQINHKICVSNFLKDYLLALQDNSPEVISLGPDPLMFYPTDCKRDIKSIAGCLRNATSKGTGLMLYNLSLAKKAGYTIHLFGKDSELFRLPPDFAIIHGDLSQNQLRKLFSEVGFYLDVSYFEGLGLLPCEAALCGAIPILIENGGASGHFQHMKNCIFITKQFLTLQFFIELQTMPLQQLRENVLELKNQLSQINAYEQFLTIFSSTLSTNGANFQVDSWQKVNNIVAIKQDIYHKTKIIITKFLRRVLKPFKPIIKRHLQVLLLRVSN